MFTSDEMTNEEYHADPALSSSAIKTVATKSLAHWKGQERKDSPAFALGSAVHAELLEPEKQLLVRGPDSRRGKIWSEGKAEAEARGKIFLTEADYDLAKEMSDACLENRMANHLLMNPEMIAEASFFATCPSTGLDLKTRPDGLIRDAGIVLDIKTTQDVSPHGFDRTIRSFGYDLQAAFYMYVLKLCDIRTENFIFIGIEKEKPHVTACYELSEIYLRHAHNRMMDTLHLIKKAQDEDFYGTQWPDLGTVHLPAWMDSDSAF
tara:strand:- start:2784 stop:3575 length:792 start_codon:yes stop_codon:yes gene_type:complete